MGEQPAWKKALQDFNGEPKVTRLEQLYAWFGRWVEQRGGVLVRDLDGEVLGYLVLSTEQPGYQGPLPLVVVLSARTCCGDGFIELFTPWSVALSEDTDDEMALELHREVEQHNGEIVGKVLLPEKDGTIHMAVVNSLPDRLCDEDETPRFIERHMGEVGQVYAIFTEIWDTENPYPERPVRRWPMARCPWHQ